MSRRVWTRPGGLVLAHDPGGWPLPAGHIDAIAGSYWTTMWNRTDVWPCHWTHYKTTCQELAVWRTVEPCGFAAFRTFWCDSHLPHAKPPDDPSPTCRVCGGPMTYADGHDTHPGCDHDSGNAADVMAAVALVRTAFADAVSA